MVEVPDEAAEELAGALGLGARGVEILAAAQGRSRLRVFLRPPVDERALRERVRRLLDAAGLDADRSAVAFESVPEGDWVERFQAGLRPFALGARLWIDPSGRHPHAPADRQRVVLVPGRAFGTGEHPTTQLCVESLERCVEPGSRWLDLGCGTGILALVAGLGGAGEVLGVDDDPEAVAVAREVARENPEAARRVRFVHGSLGHAAGGWNGIVANIAAPFFLERAAALVAALGDGGWLVASGFVTDHADEIRVALERAGLAALEHEQREPWSVLLGRRSG